jgi:ATP-dependent helicase/nuclease subunit A
MITAVEAASKRQHEAVAPEVSAWVSASAGSGKTKVLIDRLLALLLRPGMRPTRLLCLTFTKAAAAEMANRLTQHLADWATMPEADLIKRIDALTNAEPDEAALRRARALFAATLDAPGGLAIMTIHAFCQSVIQRFPLEAGVAPNFAILEDAEADALLLDARNAVLTEAQSGATPDADALSQAFLRLSSHAGETRFGDIMRAVCGQRSRLKRLLGPDDAVGPAIEALARCLRVPSDFTEAAVVSAAIDAVRAREAEFLDAASALDRGTQTDQETAANLRAFLAGQSEFDDFQLIFLTGDHEIRKNLVKKAVAKARPDVADFMDRAARTQLEVLERRKSARLFELSASAFTLGAAILKRYEAAKQARLRLDYDDLILKTIELLGREGGVSWAMFKLDEGVDHILIDEAQDTNPDQWKVVTALTEEFFAGSERPRTLMVVGDSKQSIYSFQGADPQIFAALRTEFGRRAALGNQAWRDVLLTHSFRSTSAVLEAVDAVFAVAESRPGVIDPGDDLLHQAIREGHAGLVELWPPAEPPESPDEDAWTPPEATADQISARDRIGLLVARKIKDMIDRQDRLASLDRPVRPGDFLVLVRSRGGFVVTFLRELKRLGVPVAGADRLALTSHIAVQDLMALGRFLLLPEDDLTLAALLKSPLIGCDDEKLMALAPGRQGSLWDALTERAEEDPTWRPVHDQLAGLLRRVDFQPPYELFARVLADGGRRRLRARLGEECDEPLDEFLAACLRFEALGAPSLQGFLLWLERAAPEVKREADAGRRDEVRVMTVHGAKGLEAPIVILPDCFYEPTHKLPPLSQKNDPLTGHPVPLWSPNQKADDAIAAALRDDARRAAIEEHRRLLYVALTRARDRLYVTGWKSQRASPNAWWDAVRRGLAARAKTVTFDFSALGFPGWIGEGLRLENPQLAKPETERRPKTAAAEAATPPDWARRMMPEESRPPRVLSPSRMAELPALRSPLAGAGGGFKRGLLIHRLLQSLPDLAPPDRPAAARRFLSQKSHGLEAQDQADIARETLAVLDHPAFAAVFGAGSRAEVPVTGRLGERLVAGQIDRLVALPDRVLIVDFKTNRPPPADLAAVDPGYLLQLALYRGLVAALYPDRPVEAALLWTDIPKLMPIPGDLLDATLARMAG